MYRKYYPVRSWGAQPRISGFPSTAVLIFSIFYQQVFFMFWWLPSMPHYFYKKLENVSCEYNRLNGWNSTLQAAWYIRRFRILRFLWTKPTIWLLIPSFTQNIYIYQVYYPVRMGILQFYTHLVHICIYICGIYVKQYTWYPGIIRRMILITSYLFCMCATDVYLCVRQTYTWQVVR